MATLCLLQNVAKNRERIEHVMATETLETVDLDEDKLKEFTLQLETDKLGPIEAVFDSGASICCIDAQFAYKYYTKWIKKERNKFNVRTAGGNIQLRHYIHLKVKVNQKQYLDRWYLLPNSPFRFICSRKLFINMGYRITSPGEFRNKPTEETLNEDLYTNIAKHIEDNHNIEKKTKERSIAIIEKLKLRDTKTEDDTRAQFRKSTRIPQICVIEKEEQETLTAITEDKVDKDIIKQISGEIESPQITEQFGEMIEGHIDNYAKDATDVGTIPGEEFKIELKPGTESIHAKPYPLPYKHAEEVEEQIQKLMDAGFITTSESAWASPTIVVPKPTRNGKKEYRMCIDYRELNNCTVKDRYNIPSMRDLYRKLRGNRIFSNFDLRSGYHHIPIRKEDQHKTAFITDSGLYEWRRLTFGFCNAPAMFQRAMDRIFKGLEFVVIYLDDVIVCSRNEQEHLEHLKIVFGRISKYKLKLRLIKCRFFQKEIKYLGLIVNKDGIQCDKSYAEKLVQMRVPQNGKELERFLGMVNWLGRFIPNLSKLTGHFSKIKNKKEEEFKWGEKEDILFEALKEAIRKTNILRHPDFEKPFYVQTDASNTALGAVLLQDFGKGILEPIEFASRKLAANELNWHVSDKELIAIVFALNKWIRYLLPRHFTVFTDHKNLEELFKYGRTKKNQRLHRWIIMLQQFDFTAKYLPGKDNYIADYLSRDIDEEEEESDNTMMLIQVDKKAADEIYALRRSERIKKKQPKNYSVDDYFEAVLNGTKLPEIIRNEHEFDIRETGQAPKKQKQPKWSELLNRDNLRKWSKKDKGIKKLKRKAKRKNKNKKIKYKIEETGEMRMKKRQDQHWRIVVPKKMIKPLLTYFHTDTNFHHQGVQRLSAIIKQRYYWKSMDKHIKQIIQECEGCTEARRKLENVRKGKLIPIEAKRPFEMISMDIVGPMPITENNNRYLLTIMDRFTRFTMAIPIANITACNVARTFINKWIYLFGAPEKLLTDNGTQFTGEVMKMVDNIMGIKHIMTTAYHPECNGLIERFHRFLKEKLKIAAIHRSLNFFGEDSWDHLIPSIVHAYNITPHSATKFEPYRLLFGRQPQLPLRMARIREVKGRKTKGYQEFLEELTRQFGILHNKAYKNIKGANKRMAQRINRDREEFEFALYDLVMYYVGNKWTGNIKKLTNNWKGPYEIIEIKNNGVDFIIRNTQDTKEQFTVHGKYLVLNEKWKRLKKRNENSK